MEWTNFYFMSYFATIFIWTVYLYMAYLFWIKLFILYGLFCMLEGYQSN